LIGKEKSEEDKYRFIIDRHHNDDGHTSSSQGKREKKIREGAKVE
jgi:hypothetical protein